jgi:hypothetical protein
MPAVAKLSYHRDTFELLGRQPIVSKSAQRLLKEWEKDHPNWLPASVREWFTLDEAVPLLGEGPSVGDLLRQQETIATQAAQRKLLCFGCLHQGVTLFHLELDDTDDPFVITIDCGRELTEPPPERFSAFVFSSLWPGLSGDRYSLVANDRAFGPMELDYLLENFTEGPRSGYRNGAEWHRTRLDRAPYHRSQEAPASGGGVWYRFFNITGRISVTKQGDPAEEGRAAWGIMAASEESLYAVARQVWGCGTLSRSLHGSRKVEKAVVQRLRTEFQSR